MGKSGHKTIRTNNDAFFDPQALISSNKFLDALLARGRDKNARNCIRFFHGKGAQGYH
ncbi:MAG TPA: hypothetical protein VKK79_18835 [Candidatus Lokiarchaeia archaeon]|nr:hypothetical protein [Candidatus Lokiarchaeia archaeon]